MDVDEAEAICEELGFTLEEAKESDDRVMEYVATIWQEEEVETSRQVPDTGTIHRHQLVEGPSGTRWMVLELGEDAVELVILEPPHPETGEVGFLETEVVTYGRFSMAYEPLTETGPDGDEVPVWGY